MLEIEERKALPQSEDPWISVSCSVKDNGKAAKDPAVEKEEKPQSLPELQITDKAKDARDSEKEQKRREASKELFGETPDKAICPEACIQPYNVGNCYFVAAMAAVAKMDPERIKNMIKVNDDGTYTVTFPGLGKSYTVGKPTKDDLALVEGGISKYGSWPIILMKAFGQHHGGGKDGKSEIYGGDNGSLRSSGINAFYKEQVKNGGIGCMPFLMSDKELQDRLVDLLSPEKAESAVAVTGSTGPFKNDKKLTEAHVFSVLKIEANKDDPGKGIVTIRNPHGGEGAVSTLTVAEFRKIFTQLSYPERKK